MCVFGGETPAGLYRIVDPVTRIARELSLDELRAEIDPVLILVARHFRGAGIDPRSLRLHLVRALAVALPQAARPMC